MPNYTYTTGRPAGNLTPAQNRPSMETNNDSISSILDVDLIGFNDNNGGYHSKSTYVVQGSNPGSAASQVVEFAKAVSGSSELFIQRDAVAAAIQMTSGTTATGVAAQSFLPGGIQIKMGSKFPAGATGSNIAINFTSQGLTNFPTAGIVAFAIANNNSRTFSVSSLTTTGFTATASSSLAAGDTFYWIAIGY